MFRNNTSGQGRSLWIFGNTVALYSERNSVTLVTETTPKRSKLVTRQARGGVREKMP